MTSSVAYSVAEKLFLGLAESRRTRRQSLSRQSGPIRRGLVRSTRRRRHRKPTTTTHGRKNVTNRIHSISAALAVGLTASVFAAAGPAQAAKICYAFQDLSTGFWVAGHGAIVETLTGAGHEVVELNGGHDANRQLEQIKDCIAQGADGIILTADDGHSETTLVAVAQENDVPIATFNRPPSDMSKGIIVVADNESVARLAVEAMAVEATRSFEGDRREAAPAGPRRRPRRPQRGQAARGLHERPRQSPRHLRDAGRDRHQVELGGRARRPRSRGHRRSRHRLHLHLVRLPLPDHPVGARGQGKWKKAGEEGHVILGGLDGDDGACKLIREGYVDSTGVQDVYLEAQLALDGILGAIEAGETQPNAVMLDPGLRALAGELRREGRRDLGLPGARRERSKPPRRQAGERRLPSPLACSEPVMVRRADGERDESTSEPARQQRSWRRTSATPADSGAAHRRLPSALLLSDYFVLYLSLTYFVVLAFFFPSLADPRNISQPALQRLAAAGGARRPDVRHHRRRHRPLAGRHHGLRQRRRRRDHGDGGRPGAARRQPALGQAPRARAAGSWPAALCRRRSRSSRCSPSARSSASSTASPSPASACRPSW